MTTRNCLVTGASRGIGSVIAGRLSAAGHRVALTARSADQLAEVAEKLPGPSLCLPADVTDPAAMQNVFSTVEETWGTVEVLVLNAGAAVAKPIAKLTDEDWQGQLDLNLTAPFRAIRRAVPAMTEGGWGRIVVISSIAGKAGEPNLAAYTASKHGVIGLVRAVAAEVARKGVTVNAVCPGYVDTPMTDGWVETISSRTGKPQDEIRTALERKQPIHRLITPEEVADVVDLCVASSAITGQAINVDGGAVQS
ncbi:SDR family NAD(P)-dependent oxidoreductase [Kibdelosporangium aridum]|uniref:NAD(P)-dependent dehydrogenase, short-chain alcohol dehydrogenase family n=1 Tax=Kibdelosporangium aridum TaxID=2030 RepID=A0A1W2FWA6_KIBAR|nr:SDR family NAD(P)-dependent oxidoreductase [Kibdelosporangium aridum]SMD26163.1 NAD(P)-dependent dehydrogenase, short-chain alcohol dehydrogenase family [Kibdelosporangium aridum]